MFCLATASSRSRHDWILEYAPPFLIIIIFFPSSYLRQAFNTIPNSSVSDTTRHDTIHFFSFLFSFFLEFEDGNFEHPLKGTDEKAAVFGWQWGGGRKKPKQIDIYIYTWPQGPVFLDWLLHSYTSALFLLLFLFLLLLPFPGPSVSPSSPFR